MPNLKVPPKKFNRIESSLAWLVGLGLNKMMSAAPCQVQDQILAYLNAFPRQKRS